MAVFYRRIIFFVMLETRICLFKLQPGVFFAAVFSFVCAKLISCHFDRTVDKLHRII